ncbi:hypothetical protein [Microbulbifer spongiae]|uniref:DUF2442 domain-containing protein n=1 Tax=Microbulbifer spongiae TaxID=2944933 RepID=A0ABY9EDE6_9GAMM|nr:hypothetical protein [Microbulbifer sp. MI-G]WKD51024.1 hypothetical protein M8T91_06280 [Microbulbifer sp. MI-G]
MRTYPIKSTEGTMYAFEVESVYISVNGIASILSTVDGISDMLQRKAFSSEENLVSFQFQGEDCVVWEPYGDSSRYWIGPKEPEPYTDFSDVEKAFERYQPFIIRKLVGDILTLKFLPHSMFQLL